MIKRKHILFLTPGFPKDEKDTRCIPALHLFLQELNRLDIVDISIITFDYPYKKGSYTWNGLTINAIGGKNKGGGFKLINWQKVIRLAKKIHKENAIDQVHSFWLNDCSVVGNRISKKIKIPHSCTLMGQDVLPSNRFFNQIKPLPKLITLSKYHEEQLQNNFSIRSSITIPWGIEKLTSTHVKIVDVIGVGNLNEVKNFTKFLSIIQLIKASVPDILVQIVGEGEQYHHLLQLTKKMELDQNVQFLGVRNREETLALMSKAKCLLHTSNFESFGMVFLEAQSLGVKIFTTPVGIAPELNSCANFQTVDEAAGLVVDFLQNYQIEPSIRTYKVEDTVYSYLNNVF